METFGKVIGAIIAGLVIAAIVSLPVMWLWNWLIPDIFGLCEIGFWQALGLSTLCSLLFSRANGSD